MEHLAHILGAACIAFVLGAIYGRYDLLRELRDQGRNNIRRSSQPNESQS